MSESQVVLWAPRAADRLTGLDESDWAAVIEASRQLRYNGYDTSDVPAPDVDPRRRWRVVERYVLDYMVYDPGDHPRLPDGGFLIAVILNATAAMRAYIELFGED